MIRIALDDAREILLELVAAVEQGEESEATRGTPAAKFSPASLERLPRRFGGVRGKISMSDDVGALHDGYAEYM
jgi:antitoxin (DNA-binding transcriptional repressor) of toxin-antitoxin stability system